MSTIKLRNLTKRFGDLVAVNNVDLDVEAGEVLCLLGPSGCGKTTTLRMVAGLDVASDGEVFLAGNRVNEMTPSQRNVAMAFQFYALYPNLNVAENLAYPLHADRLGADEIDRKVREVARVLGLTEVLGRLPGRLAEGEKQRVSVGRAIVRDPNCFLFDEPLSRLDVQLREQMRGQIKEVLSGLKKATIIVTHDQLEALTMADRIAVMNDGTIEQVGTPHEIFATPANLFVAGFIGTPQMNLLPATYIGQENSDLRFKTSEQEITIPLSLPVDRLQEGSAVTIGIRPRGTELTSEAAVDTLTATVDLIEPMGAETLLHLSAGGRDLRVIVGEDVEVCVGERLHVRPALCIVSLAFVFQPFSVTLFGIGMASVVVGGLAFNLVPLCEPGKSFGSIIRAAVIVVVILVAVTGLAIGSAELYGIYLRR